MGVGTWSGLRPSGYVKKPPTTRAVANSPSTIGFMVARARWWVRGPASAGSLNGSGAVYARVHRLSPGPGRRPNGEGSCPPSPIEPPPQSAASGSPALNGLRSSRRRLWTSPFAVPCTPSSSSQSEISPDERLYRQLRLVDRPPREAGSASRSSRQPWSPRYLTTLIVPTMPSVSCGMQKYLYVPATVNLWDQVFPASKW